MRTISSRIARREFLGRAAAAGAATLLGGRFASAAEETLRKDWLARWEKNILRDARNRYCDREMGEEIGWLISPFLSGFYYGYLATQDTKWVDMLLDWADAWIKRGVKEPDGYLGWPKAGGASTGAVADLYTDNLLGEAMGLRPVVLMADTILKTPALRPKYGRKAEGYLKLAERTFDKWDDRGCWRQVKAGGLWVVPLFGIDRQTGRWTAGYDAGPSRAFRSRPTNRTSSPCGCWPCTQRPRRPATASAPNCGGA